MTQKLKFQENFWTSFPRFANKGSVLPASQNECYSYVRPPIFSKKFLHFLTEAALGLSPGSFSLKFYWQKCPLRSLKK